MNDEIEKPGRGMVRLPDGRVIGATTKEYRDFLKANPDQRKGKNGDRSKRKGPPPNLDFSAPPPQTGTPDGSRIPQEDSGDKPRGYKTKTQTAQDNTNDFAEMIGGVYAAFAGLTGCETWKLTTEEADAIARPATRMLARNKRLAKSVDTLVDPIALSVAIIAPTSLRWALYQQQLKEAKAMSRRPTIGAPVQQQAPPPPPPPRRSDASTPAPPPPPSTPESYGDSTSTLSNAPAGELSPTIQATLARVARTGD